ncbi:YrbL family protein [Vibrio ziniensis]|uniref:PhoP regulatory network protein YrbL n=1 Tax=Vibrio ziniensis TaxID=2711221 RepID=A0A6G7CLM7_9VIBR|nr:YrbL family protein [Vibrio ziniensis]QIH43009.1 hypothetical protein G5S32_14110 [Vibrio ziniensis]
MVQIQIDEKLKIGQGNERMCVIHPEDAAKCIKVNIPGVIHRSQNKIENYYLSSLKRRSVPFTHIAKFYGTVETDQGQGLVFKRIVDFDGTPSIRFDKAIEQQIICSQQAKSLLDELNQYLLEHAIYIGDCNKDQILLQRTESGYLLKVIDGLGSRNYGWKLMLLSNIKWYARKKIKAKWPRILQNYVMQ